jgi:hypothetical protein
MAEDKALWLNLATQWNQLAAEAERLPAWRFQESKSGLRCVSRVMASSVLGYDGPCKAASHAPVAT